MRKLLITICLLLVCSNGWAAVVAGTNAGFVSSAPSADPEGSTSSNWDDRIRAAKHTAPAGATAITSVGAYIVNATEAANMEIGIYADSAGYPGELLGKVEFAKGTTAGWKTANLSLSITAGTDYWIGLQIDDTATRTDGDVTYSSGDGYRPDSDDNLTALPNPFTASLTATTDLYALYAVYTTEAVSSRRIFVTQ